MPDEKEKEPAPKPKREANPFILAVSKAILAVIVGVIVATYTYHLGKSEGEKGKKPGFDQIQTSVKLDGTKWQVKYEDIDEEGTPIDKVATVDFEQFGSRIVGEGRDNTGRKWIVEGAAAERRVCYIYYDPQGVQLSMGSVILEMHNNGRLMTGQWFGWSPESDQPQPRKVTLTKLDN